MTHHQQYQMELYITELLSIHRNSEREINARMSQKQI